MLLTGWSNHYFIALHTAHGAFSPEAGHISCLPNPSPLLFYDRTHLTPAETCVLPQETAIKSNIK